MNPKAMNWIAALLLLAALATASSCSSSNSSNPTGPNRAVRELNSGDFGSGDTYQHRFAVAGTFAYHCIHHAPMTGTVHVSASAPDTVANVSITTSSSSFPVASVKPGGRVVWTNNTAMVHTVTSD